MRHYLLTRSAYGSAWSLEANRRRLDLSRGVTIRSVRAQTSHDFEWLVLLHRADPLLAERMAAFAGARFLYLDADGPPDRVALAGYRAGWAEAIGPRDEAVAMTRLDDDDALAPWVMERIEGQATDRRGILVMPNGIRVWQGRFTVVRHHSNAMQTLITPPGDRATVYDYGHRKAAAFAPVRLVDSRIAWLWSRHADTISGWRSAEHPLAADFRAMFPVDWRLFGSPQPQARQSGAHGRLFR